MRQQWKKFPREANLNCASLLGRIARDKWCNFRLDKEFVQAFNPFVKQEILQTRTTRR
jgi:hypothetical protein